ncbi:hypothetical protein A5482_011105 [Cyanobacterium sp. IPPAS B-1200]|uniref:hypothetical protein n=1 Tax=Cyanobacterium sp. IPPAS B-1200 TaxID=1562720 RepID=UPI000852555D|nr:hypothetical protein [Cyanobacterium sp. IPPAS B-1200]OEJ80091.1 hypothetical protein A5482_07275 [Cyanobacterium sp. IPPAS B-1200]
MSERENSSPDNDDFDLGGAIFELESAIAQLKQRYNQVEKDQIRQKVLKEEKKELEKQLKRNSQNSIKTEINLINQQLEEIEVRLETQLFKWSSLNEPFWQIVRFGGFGIIIGWILKSLST